MAGMESCHRNYSNGSQKKQCSQLSESFRGQLQSFSDSRNAAALCEGSHVLTATERGAPVHLAPCGCCGHFQHIFGRHDHQHVDGKSCYHMPSIRNGNHFDHLRCVFDLGCCGTFPPHPGSGIGIDSAVGRKHPADDPQELGIGRCKSAAHSEAHGDNHIERPGTLKILSEGLQVDKERVIPIKSPSKKSDEHPEFPDCFIHKCAASIEAVEREPEHVQAKSSLQTRNSIGSRFLPSQNVVDSAFGRKCPAIRTSISSEPRELSRDCAAGSRMTFFNLKSSDGENRSPIWRPLSMENSVFMTPRKDRKKQVILYDWFLMRPRSENFTKSSSTNSEIALGGYRSPRMAETDLFETGPIVQRLERWKLLTSDGLEVGLMGLINLEKSIANSFSPAVVQCFMIGFPSSWNYMLRNLNNVVCKSSCPDIPSPSDASPSYRHARDLRNDIEINRSPEHFNVVSVEANATDSISRASTSPPSDEELTKSNFPVSKILAEALRSKIYDANSAPRACQFDNDQVDGLTDILVNKIPRYADKLRCPESDFPSDNALLTRQTSIGPKSHSPCEQIGSALLDICDVPESNSESQGRSRECPITKARDVDEEAVVVDFQGTVEHRIGVFEAAAHSEVSSQSTVAENQDKTDLEILPAVCDICNSSHDHEMVGCKNNVHLENLSGTSEGRGDFRIEPEHEAPRGDDHGFPCTPVQVIRKQTRVDTHIALSEKWKNVTVVDDEIIHLDYAISQPSNKIVNEFVIGSAADLDTGTQNTVLKDTSGLYAQNRVALMPLTEPRKNINDNIHQERVDVSALACEELELQIDEDKEGQENDMEQHDNKCCWEQSVENRISSRKKRVKVKKNYFRSKKRKTFSNMSSSVQQSKRPAKQDILSRESEVNNESIAPLKGPNKKLNVRLQTPSKSVQRCSPTIRADGEPEQDHPQSCRHTLNSIIPPPLPSPRVLDKSKVTEAFGLKKSLRGRILVPPLATWRSQTIQYDMDGGIIAISDGIVGSASDDCTDCYNFKLPSDKNARIMQRKLCEAAMKGPRGKRN